MFCCLCSFTRSPASHACIFLIPRLVDVKPDVMALHIACALRKPYWIAHCVAQIESSRFKNISPHYESCQVWHQRYQTSVVVNLKFSTCVEIWVSFLEEASL